MNAQAGFTLTEMLAAIFVLSLGAMAASEAIAGLIQGWERTENTLEQNKRVSAALERIAIVQSAHREASSELALVLTPELDLILARPRVDHDASCRFDLVARQCR